MRPLRPASRPQQHDLSHCFGSAPAGYDTPMGTSDGAGRRTTDELVPQAVGVLMARHHLPESDAHHLLVNVADKHGMSLIDAAYLVVLPLGLSTQPDDQAPA